MSDVYPSPDNERKAHHPQLYFTDDFDSQLADERVRNQRTRRVRSRRVYAFFTALNLLLCLTIVWLVLFNMGEEETFLSQYTSNVSLPAWTTELGDRATDSATNLFVSFVANPAVNPVAKRMIPGLGIDAATATPTRTPTPTQTSMPTQTLAPTSIVAPAGSSTSIPAQTSSPSPTSPPPPLSTSRPTLPPTSAPTSAPSPSPVFTLLPTVQPTAVVTASSEVAVEETAPSAGAMSPAAEVSDMSTPSDSSVMGLIKISEPSATGTPATPTPETGEAATEKRGDGNLVP